MLLLTATPFTVGTASVSKKSTNSISLLLLSLTTKLSLSLILENTAPVESTLSLAAAPVIIPSPLNTSA